ncbi:MAG: PaaI family thioesterase [Woeseia sp.]
MSERLDTGRRIPDSQPFSRLLGARLTAFEAGRAVLELDITDELKQQYGFVHGGVLSYLADNCLTNAAASVLGDLVTSEYKINYLRPAIGRTLVATESVQHAGSNQAVCNCEVAIDDGEFQKIVAIAQGTISRISPGNRPATAA